MLGRIPKPGRETRLIYADLVFICTPRNEKAHGALWFHLSYTNKVVSARIFLTEFSEQPFRPEQNGMQLPCTIYNHGNNRERASKKWQQIRVFTWTDGIHVSMS